MEEVRGVKGERHEMHELTACSGDEEHEGEHERVVGSMRRSVKSVRRMERSWLSYTVSIAL